MTPRDVCLRFCSFVSFFTGKTTGATSCPPAPKSLGFHVVSCREAWRGSHPVTVNQPNRSLGVAEAAGVSSPLIYHLCCTWRNPCADVHHRTRTVSPASSPQSIPPAPSRSAGSAPPPPAASHAMGAGGTGPPTRRSCGPQKTVAGEPIMFPMMFPMIHHPSDPPPPRPRQHSRKCRTPYTPEPSGRAVSV